ncbi:small metal-binding protein SmbP [Methylocaldum sp.]|uniref:small metal-binding protein SmbP n=1 Tax=Methylocaldum sp. TaxID=1969727 RepID=UPI002D28A529|nr:small metal-binding protein SmbP [Methylocaldum sp.]HYE34695.1 small metal-binding protein SmbP [Methylocaldum sp.]
MRGKILSGLLAGLFSLSLSLTAVAAEDHKAEAMKHTQAAVDSSKKGDAKGVAEHAEAAKTHAAAANKEKANPHLDAALKSLDGAIEHGKMGHADIAGKAAEEAMTHLNAVKQ